MKCLKKAHNVLECFDIVRVISHHAQHIEISYVGIEPRVGDVHFGALEYVQGFNVSRNFPAQQLAHQPARPNVGVGQEVERPGP